MGESKRGPDTATWRRRRWRAVYARGNRVPVLAIRSISRPGIHPRRRRPLPGGGGIEGADPAPGRRYRTRRGDLHPIRRLAAEGGTRNLGGADRRLLFGCPAPDRATEAVKSTRPRSRSLQVTLHGPSLPIPFKAITLGGELEDRAREARAETDLQGRSKAGDETASTRPYGIASWGRAPSPFMRVDYLMRIPCAAGPRRSRSGPAFSRCLDGRTSRCDSNARGPRHPTCPTAKSNSWSRADVKCRFALPWGAPASHHGVGRDRGEGAAS